MIFSPTFFPPFVPFFEGWVDEGRVEVWVGGGGGEKGFVTGNRDLKQQGVKRWKDWGPCFSGHFPLDTCNGHC